MFRKILVALDRTPAAEAAISYVKALCQATGAHPTLLTVTTGDLTEMHLAQAYLEGVSRFFKPGTVDLEVAFGPPGAIIVETAARGGFELVILASQRATGLKHLILDSVAESALHATTVPMLMVSSKMKWTGPSKFRRILVALDGSHRAAKILESVSGFALAYDAQVRLLTVKGPKALDLPGWSVSAHLMEERMQLAQQGIDARIVVQKGDPAKEILEYATRWGAHLIAMTTHGRTGVDLLRYGSVAEKVLRHGAFPMLMMRTASLALSGRVLGNQEYLGLTHETAAGHWDKIGPI